MRFIAFRNLIGVTHTEAEAKALAAEYMVSGALEVVPRAPLLLFQYFFKVATSLVDLLFIELMPYKANVQSTSTSHT